MGWMMDMATGRLLNGDYESEDGEMEDRRV